MSRFTNFPPGKILRSLAFIFLLASLLRLEGTAAAASPDVQKEVAAAVAAYLNGDAEGSKARLAGLLSSGSEADLATQLSLADTLLDLCTRAYDEECVTRYGSDFFRLVERQRAGSTAPSPLAQRLTYYLAFSLFQNGSMAELRAKVLGKLLDGPGELPADTRTYLQRQLLAGAIYAELGEREKAQAAADKALSLIASLNNPEAARFEIAGALSDAIGLLVRIGEVERAKGVYFASADMIAKTLPPHTVSGILFRTHESDLLQELGDFSGSRSAAEAALAGLTGARIPDSTRTWLAAQNQAVRAVLCVRTNNLGCAQDAVRSHPYHERYRNGGEAPGTIPELAYLTTKALVTALSSSAGEPTVLRLLRLPQPQLSEVLWEKEFVSAYRLVGLALARPKDAQRSRELFEAGLAMLRGAKAMETSAFASWYRPSAIDQLVLMLALAQSPEFQSAEDKAATIEMAQLLERGWVLADTDATAALGTASDEGQRSFVHRALRLRARRDRAERLKLSAAAMRVAAGRPSGRLNYDARGRMVFADYARELGRSFEALGRNNRAEQAFPLATADEIQTQLAADEVVLSLVPLFDGKFLFQCIRRDKHETFLSNLDAAALARNKRLLQLSLSADHAPSEELDSQYPAEAALWLHDRLLKPFSVCLRPKDRIIWLPGLAQLGFPLSALLTEMPPRRGQGFDLQQAKWVLNNHDISYPGSAAALVASRRARRARPNPPLDFLGIGDPLLSGATESGQMRQALVTRGLRRAAGVNGLTPLPETRPELQASAAPFKAAKLLLSNEATEGSFRQQFLGSYRYLSFATHGLVRDDLDGLTAPALVLTPVSTDPRDDGLLTADEIADLRLNADFVALSACNTADFDVAMFASELPALASAFAVAGVPASLGTLWPVDSKTSQIVTSHVFEQLARGGMGPAAATANAQRRFIRTAASRVYHHPRFWAPFVLLGDGGLAARSIMGPPRLTLEKQHAISGTGAEILAVKRSGSGWLAAFIGGQTDGKHDSGVLRASERGPRWTSRGPNGASDLLFSFGRTAVVGNYDTSSDGKVVALLTAFEAGTGRALRQWRGSQLTSKDSIFLASAQISPQKAVAILSDADFSGHAPSATTFRAQVVEFDPSLQPKPLFEIHLPVRTVMAGARNDVEIIPRGAGFIVAFSDRSSVSNPSATLDDWSVYGCDFPSTKVQFWDASGKLKQEVEVPGFALNASDGRRGFPVLLAGALQESCSAREAGALFVLDDALRPKLLFKDEDPTPSTFRAMARAPSGHVAITSHRTNISDVPPPQTAGAVSYAEISLRQQVSGQIILLNAAGKEEVRYSLDSGSDVFLRTIDGSEPGKLLVGGAVGDQAALLWFGVR